MNVRILQENVPERVPEWLASNKDLSGFRDFPYAVQTQAKTYEKSPEVERPPQLTKGLERDYGMDMSI